jgi:GNAT superfamily N-acetyltransferase
MVEIKLHNPYDLDSGEWHELQAISREGFQATLGRSQEEVDYLVQWNDPTRFYLSHMDPAVEAGKRFNPNQSYSQLRVAIAYDGADKVGFAYSAHNTSGATEQIRQAKRLSIAKNYLWFREIAVRPDLHRQGIARKMGLTLLEDAIPFQPVAAYVWPEVVPFLPEALSKLGFNKTAEKDINLFGQDKAQVTQARYKARFALGVLSKLRAYDSGK